MCVIFDDRDYPFAGAFSTQVPLFLGGLHCVAVAFSCRVQKGRCGNKPREGIPECQV